MTDWEKALKHAMSTLSDAHCAIDILCQVYSSDLARFELAQASQAATQVQKYLIAANSFEHIIAQARVNTPGGK